MPASVVLKDLNLGYAGKVSRNPLNKVDAKFVKSILDGNGAQTLSNIPFGSAVVLNTDNTVSVFGQTGVGVATASATTFAGIAVAEVQQPFTYALGAAGGSPAGQYSPLAPCDRLTEGTIMVKTYETSLDAGGPVYIVTVAGTHTPIGTFVKTASTDSSTAVLLTGCSWVTGKIDSNSVAELSIRVAVTA